MKRPLSLFAFVALLAGCAPEPPMRDVPVGSPESGVESAADDGAPDYVEFKSLQASDPARQTLVIMYHDVVEKRSKDTLWYDVSERELREQLQFIHDNGGQVVTLAELYAGLVDGKALPKRAVALTFDDNYQGVKDVAAPILESFKYPYTVFAHTDFVGNVSQGRPKMSWDTLKELMATGLCTVGSHTVTHPENIATLDSDQQRAELENSRLAIETNLGVKTPWLAWPNGEFDANCETLAEQAGYRLGLTMNSGPAQASPTILSVNRYSWNKFKKGWEEREAALKLEPAWSQVETNWKASPVHEETLKMGPARYVALVGGTPMTALADGRKGVAEFVKEFHGVGGINGGFFVMAAIASDDNRMIGPCVVENKPNFMPPPDVPGLNEKLRNRPLLVWNKEKVVITPYDPEIHRTDEALRDIVQDRTNAFLAGAWLVCDGYALSKEQILEHGAKDAMDYRRRAFFGVTAEGEPVCGASTNSVNSENLARAALQLGCKHAVLLDSGFSTSLVLGETTLVSGHSSKDVPSRPVPHAIVLQGELDASAPKPEIEVSVEPIGATGRSKSRHRRRR